MILTMCRLKVASYGELNMNKRFWNIKSVESNMNPIKNLLYISLVHLRKTGTSPKEEDKMMLQKLIEIWLKGERIKIRNQHEWLLRQG